jgi:hypothetical protein
LEIFGGRGWRRPTVVRHDGRGHGQEYAAKIAVRRESTYTTG